MGDRGQVDEKRSITAEEKVVVRDGEEEEEKLGSRVRDRTLIRGVGKGKNNDDT